jgi:hypothetical protein
MAKGPRQLKVVISNPPGGYDEKRLQRALNLLISEKDFIRYFRRRDPDRSAAPGANPATSKNNP